MIDVSVVIGFRNWGLPRLALALRSHNESPMRDRVEVLVADYGSDNWEEVKQVTEDNGGVHVHVETDGHWSRSRALNAGVEAARGEAVITTDADLLFTPELVPMAYARLQDDRRSVQLVQCRDLTDAFGVDEIETYDWDAFERNSTFRPRWGMGGMVAFWRSALAEVGGYDERMEIYGGEDRDFAQRVAWAGYRLSWIDDPKARIYHVWHPSSRGAANLTVEGKEAIERNRSIFLNDKTVVRNVCTPTLGPLATVAIATCNRAPLLGECLATVLAQRVDDVEVLVVDDGSTDETREVVESFADPRLRYIRKDNGGVASARNRAIAEARGKYIVVHDDDDIMLPWRIEAQFEALTVGSHGTYGGWVDFDADGALRPQPGKEFSQGAVLFTGSVLLHPTLMLRRDVLERFPYNEKLLAGSDYNLVLRMATAGVLMNHTGEFHVLRRLHESNLTVTLADHQKESARRTTNLIRRRLDKAEEDSARRAARALEPLRCRGDEDVVQHVRPYLPDALVKRSVSLVGRDQAALSQAKTLLTEARVDCTSEFLIGQDGDLIETVSHARGVTWPMLARLRAIPGIDFRIAGVAGADVDGAGPEPNGARPATTSPDLDARLDTTVLQSVVVRMVEALTDPKAFITLSYSSAQSPTTRKLWRSDAAFRELLTIGGVQYAAMGVSHPTLEAASVGVSDALAHGTDVRSVVVDLSDADVTNALKH